MQSVSLCHRLSKKQKVGQNKDLVGYRKKAVIQAVCLRTQAVSIKVWFQASSIYKIYVEYKLEAERCQRVQVHQPQQQEGCKRRDLVCVHSIKLEFKFVTIAIARNLQC